MRNLFVESELEVGEQTLFETRARRVVQVLDAPWKFAAVSVVGSILITTLLSGLIWGIHLESFLTANGIAIACSGPLSYMVAVVGFRYLEVLDQKNKLLEQQAQVLKVRNADLRAFAHTVAHDLKNPIGNLTGYAELLQDMMADEMIDREQVMYITHRMRSQGIKTVSIVEDLLLLAELSYREVPFTAVDTHAVTQTAVQRIEDLFRKSYPTAEISPAESAVWPAVYGYGSWVEFVLINYLSNALKYGGDPVRITIGCESTADDKVRLWVRDNGRGLTEAEQATVFTEFTRLHHKPADGHGLGLSIVARIAAKLNGRAGVDSPPGEGCTFYVLLPAVPNNASSIGASRI